MINVKAAFTCISVAAAFLSAVALCTPARAQAVAAAQEEDFGLTVPQIADVLKKVDQVYHEPSAVDAVRAFQGVPVAPLLIHLAQSEDEPIRRREGAVMWLGKSKDARAVPALKGGIDALLTKPLTEDDATLLMTAMWGLGYTGRDAALDMLFPMTHDAFWEERRVAFKDPQEPPEVLVDRLQGQAVMAIATSGTERALEAFVTGKGLPGDPHANRDDDLRIIAQRMAGIATIDGDPSEPKEVKERRANAIVERAKREYGASAPGPAQ